VDGGGHFLARKQAAAELRLRTRLSSGEVNNLIWKVTQNQSKLKGSPSIQAMRSSRIASMVHLFGPMTFAKPVFALSVIESTRVIQKLYDGLAQEMHDSPIVDSAYSQNHPAGHKSSYFLSKTHPIFYVSITGSLVFLPNTSIEYARYRYQQHLLGKMGLHPWMRRGYLSEIKPPGKSAKDTEKLVEKWERDARRGLADESNIRRERWSPAPSPQPGFGFSRSLRVRSSPANGRKVILTRRARRH
ncbi:MAG: hypothetical protein AABW68_02260, partial [archaeon]